MSDFKDPDMTEQILGLLAHVGPMTRGAIQIIIVLQKVGVDKFASGAAFRDTINERISYFHKRELLRIWPHLSAAGRDKLEITQAGIEHLREVAALRLGF